MSNDTLEEVDIDGISRWTDIPVDVVREYRQISYDEAISRFLTNKSRGELARAGYMQNPKTREQKLRAATALIGHLEKFKDDFYKTQEGRLWYECNVPDNLRICAEIQPVHSGYPHIDRLYGEEMRRTRFNLAKAMSRRAS